MVPGAGTYDLPSRLVESTGKTMGAKTAGARDRVNAPGPGAYKQDKQKRENYSYSFGGKIDDLLAKQQMYKPGPGNYEHRGQLDVPSTKFGSGQRGNLEHSRDIRNVPGPGSYKQEKESVLRMSPKFGFGSSKRGKSEYSSRYVPGPGTYHSQRFLGKEGK